MKTVLIVNPWIYDFAAYDLWMKPWGLLKISSILKASGCKVILVDAMDRHHSAIPQEVQDKPDGTGKFISEDAKKPDILKDIPRKYKRYGLSPEMFKRALPSENIDIILVSSGMTYWYPGVFESIKILKERYKAPIILGGVYATLCYDHAVRNSGADHVVKSGEVLSLSEILAVKCDLSFRNILEAEADISFYSKNPYAVIRLSLGCPFNCAYCAQKLLSPPFMLKSSEGAEREISGLYEKGIRNFAFYDDALLFDGEYVEKYFGYIIKEGIDANFYTPNGLHARFLTEKLARLMKKINFISPILSLETANDQTASSWHDKINRSEFEKAVQNLNEAGYEKGQYTAYLMLGAPGSSFSDVEESMKFANSLGAKISLSEFSPVSGTLMAEGVLDKSKDPLLQNNSVFPFFSSCRVEKAMELKERANKLNRLLLPLHARRK